MIWHGQYVIQDLKHILVDLLDRELHRDLQNLKHHLDAGYLAKKMWRAYMLSFILNMDCTNDLIRDLEENPNLIEICGFDMSKPLPNRRTFNRFICSLAEHQDMVERFLDRVISQLAQRLPGFGVTVAIDSSSVRSHSHPGKFGNGVIKCSSW